MNKKAKRVNKRPTQMTVRGVDATLWRKIETHRKKMERETGLPWSTNRAVLSILQTALARR